MERTDILLILLILILVFSVITAVNTLNMLDSVGTISMYIIKIATSLQTISQDIVYFDGRLDRNEIKGSLYDISDCLYKLIGDGEKSE